MRTASEFRPALTRKRQGITEAKLAIVQLRASRIKLSKLFGQGIARLIEICPVSAQSLVIVGRDGREGARGWMDQDLSSITP